MPRGHIPQHNANPSSVRRPATLLRPQSGTARTQQQRRVALMSDAQRRHARFLAADEMSAIRRVAQQRPRSRDLENERQRRRMARLRVEAANQRHTVEVGMLLAGSFGPTFLTRDEKLLEIKGQQIEMASNYFDRLPIELKYRSISEITGRAKLGKLYNILDTATAVQGFTREELYEFKNYVKEINDQVKLHQEVRGLLNAGVVLPPPGRAELEDFNLHGERLGPTGR